MKQDKTMAASTQLIEDLRPRKFGTPGKIWTLGLCCIIVLGIFSYIRQLNFGLEVTGMRDYAFWGIYISNFVFFVAISLVGSLVTAILRLSGAEWSIPLTRIAEIIAVSAIVMAGITIIVDMGRPDRLWHLFAFGRLQSPIIWDVIVITTYLCISLLLLYYPLIPDFSILKSHMKNSMARRVFKALSMNWRGSSRQKKLHGKAIKILAITIIPVAFGIHTVTSWLFATTYRPGWDSTNFGAYFVSGAFVVGAGGVIVAMYVIRKSYHLERYINEKLFDRVGKLLVMLCLLYLYFNINEYLVPAYKLKEMEELHIISLFTGHYALQFWTVIIGGLVLPILILLIPAGRKPLPLFIISVVVVIAAWWKRFLIVTPTLLHPFLPMNRVPEEWTVYHPTYDEWMITLATLACALLIITFLVRYLPVIPIAEYEDHINNKVNEN